jgi:hypothetical protein
MVPYADWNLLKVPDKDQAMAKILDLAMLSDIFPTGYHGCVTAGVITGSTVYIAVTGPVTPANLRRSVAVIMVAEHRNPIGFTWKVPSRLNDSDLRQATSFQLRRHCRHDDAGGHALLRGRG